MKQVTKKAMENLNLALCSLEDCTDKVIETADLQISIRGANCRLAKNTVVFFRETGYDEKMPVQGVLVSNKKYAIYFTHSSHSHDENWSEAYMGQPEIEKFLREIYSHAGMPFLKNKLYSYVYVYRQKPEAWLLRGHDDHGQPFYSPVFLTEKHFLIKKNSLTEYVAIEYDIADCGDIKLMEENIIVYSHQAYKISDNLKTYLKNEEYQTDDEEKNADDELREILKSEFEIDIKSSPAKITAKK